MSLPIRIPLFILASLASLLVLNCPANPIVAEEVEIEFSFFYRATAQSKAETKQFSLKVPLVEGDVPERSLGISKIAQFKNMFGNVLIEYNSVYVYFMGEKGMISAARYQIGKTPINSFDGGHGFTGLLYVHDSASDAQIQFFAKVKGQENEAEQGVADQPATAPKSKPEGKEKSKPEPEGRSR